MIQTISNKNYISNIIVLISILSFIFLWSYENNFLNLRYLILLLLIPTIIKIKYNKWKIDRFFTFFLLFVVIQLFFASFLNNSAITNHKIYSLIFFILISISVYFNHFEIRKSLSKIIFIFLIIFLLSTFYSLIFFKNDFPFFCGGIPNYFNIDMSKIYPLSYAPERDFDYNVTFKHILFIENSHLGMVAPGLILFSIYKIYMDKRNYIHIILTTFLIIICLFKSSTTFYVGIIVSTGILILFEYKRLPNKLKIFYVFFSIIMVIIIFTDKECKTRFIPSYNNEQIINQKTTDIVSEILNADANKIKSGSLSSAVYFNALKITKNALTKNFTGWGFNSYNDAFDSYILDNNLKNSYIEGYNKKDGVNNLNKILVEFGFFSLIILWLIFKYTINKDVDLDQKLFFLPLIITQLIRGAGYFNGGFILVLLIMYFSISSRKHFNL